MTLSYHYPMLFLITCVYIYLFIYVNVSIDEKGVFRDGNFHKALSKLEKSDDDIGSGGSGKKGGKGGADGEGAGGKGKGAQGKKGGTSEVYKVVKLVTEKKLDPAIVFSFSKKDCETHALECAKLDLCTEEEKSLITQIYKNAMEALNDDDKKLPQVRLNYNGYLWYFSPFFLIIYQSNHLLINSWSFFHSYHFSFAPCSSPLTPHPSPLTPHPLLIFNNSRSKTSFPFFVVVLVFTMVVCYLY